MLLNHAHPGQVQREVLGVDCVVWAAVFKWTSCTDVDS
jgi:hypothetical protein